jgi:hypothetical protein
MFAMTTEGQHLGIYTFSGASAQDWEDMALGPGPAAGVDYLFAGDIGDNGATRPEIVVYRVLEPPVSVDQSPVTMELSGVERITLRYPDGARDAETLIVDPLNGDIYVISKREDHSRVYVAPYPQPTTSPATMQLKGELPWGWTTGGGVSPSGAEVIVRGYSSASIWQRPEGGALWEAFLETECPVSLMPEPQGEAIGFAADGDAYYTISESLFQPIYYFERKGPTAHLLLY